MAMMMMERPRQRLSPSTSKFPVETKQRMAVGSVGSIIPMAWIWELRKKLKAIDGLKQAAGEQLKTAHETMDALAQLKTEDISQAPPGSDKFKEDMETFKTLVGKSEDRALQAKMELVRLNDEEVKLRDELQKMETKKAKEVGGNTPWSRGSDSLHPVAELNRLTLEMGEDRFEEGRITSGSDDGRCSKVIRTQPTGSTQELIPINAFAPEASKEPAKTTTAPAPQQGFWKDSSMGNYIGKKEDQGKKEGEQETLPKLPMGSTSTTKTDMSSSASSSTAGPDAAAAGKEQGGAGIPTEVSGEEEDDTKPGRGCCCGSSCFLEGFIRAIVFLCGEC